MEFDIQRKENENIYKYPTEDIELTQKFTEILRKELHDFLMGVVVFGSVARKKQTEHSDIDLLLIVNDSTFVITQELIEGYRIIVEQAMQRVSPKFHITSMTFTSFWDHSRNGDPVVINIIRDGLALYDQGFFDPLQRLLKAGKLRPSEESVWRYFGRAPKTLLNSRWHVLQATLDLYWAVIDAAHAALMRKNTLPPTPDHVADELERVYVKKKLLDKKYVIRMRKFYDMSKNITHRKIEKVTGAEFEKLYLEADDFIEQMKKLVQKRN